MHTNNNRRFVLFRVLLSFILISLAPTVADAAAVGSPASQAARSDGELTYTVKVNDTLWDIAAAFDISVDALMAANPDLDPQLLQTGQTLVIPGVQAAPPPAPGTATYTVSPNDTLWDIATAHRVSVDALVAANPGVDPKALHEGQVLTIPAATEGTAAPAAGNPPASTPYTIRQDDTLWTIAATFDVTVEALTAANPGVDPKLLRAGQVLKVPGVHKLPAEAAPAPAEAAAPAADQPPPGEAAPAEAAPEQPAAEQPPAEPAPTPEPPPPPPAPAGMPAEFVDAANRIIARMNEQRAARGIGQLTWSAELAAAAQAHANDCAARNKGSHFGSDGARLETRLARAGYPAVTSSENWANSRTATAAFDMWFNESNKGPHRRNILDSHYKEIGIGIALGGWGYYVIADFGSR
jgi:LysM repeat protein